MEEYKVLIYPSAMRDMQEIVEYINTLSPQAAITLYDSIVEKISSLSRMPNRCPAAKDITLKAKGYRYMTAENYLVFYVIDQDTVQIRRILYSKRRYEELL